MVLKGPHSSYSVQHGMTSRVPVRACAIGIDHRSRTPLTPESLIEAHNLTNRYQTQGVSG